MVARVISGGLTLAVLVLPITIIVTAEALRAVPASIREAGFGVGATRWEVIRSHVLPYAAPGILTGIILTLARAFGETAPLLLVGAAATGFAQPANATIIDQLTGPYTSLPTIIYSWSRNPNPEFRALDLGGHPGAGRGHPAHQRHGHHPEEPICTKVVTP